jgi:fused signal recognition particle receptor
MIDFRSTLGLEAVLRPEIAAASVLLVFALAWLLWQRRRRTRAGGPELAGEAPPGVLAAAPAATAPAHVALPSSYERLQRGLARTRQGFMARLAPILARSRMDQDALAELETALLTADVGVEMTERLLGRLRSHRDGEEKPVREQLQREMVTILEAVAGAPREPSARPWVVMIVGVNGVGKTTSIGKLAARSAAAGKSVLLVAADTFRAAAIEQLAIWAERAHATLIRQQQGSDPGAVVYDGIRAAIARHVDVVMVDTAGRLHTKSNLMEELRKVRRILARELPGAPHETLLVLDAVTGQNGIVQARAFVEALEVDGVILTKLDGTAKGGVVVAIAGELGIPIRYVGVGEELDDLRQFDARQFVAALFGTPGREGSLDT